jgi:hypothetical protein
VRTDFPQIPVGTSQRSDFWLSDERAEQLLPLVDFIGANIYPAWGRAQADVDNQPNGVTAEAGFESFCGTYSRTRSKYSGRRYGVDTSSPFNYHFGLIDAAEKPKGILFRRTATS